MDQSPWGLLNCTKESIPSIVLRDESVCLGRNNLYMKIETLR